MEQLNKEANHMHEVLESSEALSSAHWSNKRYPQEQQKTCLTIHSTVYDQLVYPINLK